MKARAPTNACARFTPQQRSQLVRRGFAPLPDFAKPDEVEELRVLLAPVLDDPLLDQRLAVRTLNTAPDDSGAREIISPSTLEPRLLHAALTQRALAFTRDLYGRRAEIMFDHVIVKAPFSRAETPWHQDAAYAPRVGRASRRLHWWAPLAGVTEETGCLVYAAGSHRGRLARHRPVASGFATKCAAGPRHGDEVVACPLPAGGVVAHLPKTLHCAGPNIAARPRVAWIFQIGVVGFAPHVTL